jgi:hypothetical protein
MPGLAYCVGGRSSGRLGAGSPPRISRSPGRVANYLNASLQSTGTRDRRHQALTTSRVRLHCAAHETERGRRAGGKY